MSVVAIAMRLGGVAERSQLLEFGATARQIASGVRSGDLVRVRRAWYATAEVTREQFIATRIGGRLGGASALATYGVWVPQSTVVYVSVAGNASRLRPSPDPERAVVVDWTDPTLPPDGQRWRVSLSAALAQSLRHWEWDECVAIFDSALHLGLIRLADAAWIIASGPPNRRHVVDYLDAAAESGIESLTRCRLVARGIPCRIQMQIPGLARIDILVGDRLVIEVDGQQFHTGQRFESDRRRDLELIALDLRPLHLSYSQVVFDWDAAEDVILRLIERGEHRSARPLFRP